MKLKRVEAFLVSVSMLALGTSGALAQSGAESQKSATQASEGQIEEVIVTAQKREQALQDVDISITALTGDQLKSRGITNTADLARVVPSFNYTDTGVDAPVYSLRGVGYFDSSVAAAPTVSVYLDEVPLGFPVMTEGASFDLQRVEVLKGPQGTLFGQNSTGGLVNYIANKPTDKFEAGFSATYGRFNEVDLESYMSGRISDTLKGRIALKNVTSGDWQKSITRNDTLGKKNESAGRMILEWDPASNVTVTFNFNGYVNRSDPLATQVIAITPLAPAHVLAEVANAPMPGDNAQLADWNPDKRPFRDDRFWQTSGRVDWQISDHMQFASITAYSDFKGRAFIDRDGMANANSEYGLDSYIHSFYQELRLLGRASFLNWTVGANYGRDQTNENSTNDLSTSSNVQNVFGVKFGNGDNRMHNDITTAAAFASGDWTLTDKLSLTTGVRYTRTKTKFVGCTDSTSPNTIAALAAISGFFRNLNGLPYVAFDPSTANGCIVLGSDFLPAEPRFNLDEDNVSWRVALDYKPTKDVLLYASATQGYKAGNSLTVAASAESQYTPVKQESLLSYETGFKSTLFDRTMQLNGAAFYYNYKDKQTRSKILDPVFGPLQALVNVPKSHAYGAELEMQWLPAEGLTVNAGVAYLKTRIDSWTGYDALGVQRNFAGKEFSFAPQWQLNGDVGKVWQISDDLLGSVGASVSYRSKANSDFGSYPLFNIKSYALVGLRAGIESADGRWNARAFVENLTDEYYWTSTVRIQDTVVRYPGMPRTYGVGVSYKF